MDYKSVTRTYTGFNEMKKEINNWIAHKNCNHTYDVVCFELLLLNVLNPGIIESELCSHMMHRENFLSCDRSKFPVSTSVVVPVNNINYRLRRNLLRMVIWFCFISIYQ